LPSCAVTASRAQPRPHLRQRIGRQREVHEDRIHLVDGDDAYRVGRPDHVADVDQARAGAAVERRGDLGVVELGARHVDRSLIGFDGGIELRHQGTRGVGLLLAHRVGGDELAEAVKIEPRVVELGFVACLVRLRLGERGLERARIELHHDVAGPHVLAFAEIDLHDLAVDARLDQHAVVGLHGADAGQIDRDVLALGRHRRHRHRGRGRLRSRGLCQEWNRAAPGAEIERDPRSKDRNPNEYPVSHRVSYDYNGGAC
jgi:hypothetical protein